MAITITSFAPAAGPTTGGTKVVITGTGLDTVGDVEFGTYRAPIDNTAVNTPTSLTVIAPPVPNNYTTPVKITLVDVNTPAVASSSTNYAYSAVVLPLLVSTTASKWKCDIDSSVALDGSGYIPVRGMTDFHPQLNTTSQDDSDYDSGKWGSDTKTLLKWLNTIKLSRKRAAGYVEDPGQRLLRIAHDQFGTGGSVRIRWYDRNGAGSEAYEGFAMVAWTEDGGNTTALNTVTCTLMGQGARTLIQNPIS